MRTSKRRRKVPVKIQSGHEIRVEAAEALGLIGIQDQTQELSMGAIASKRLR